MYLAPEYYLHTVRYLASAAFSVRAAPLEKIQAVAARARGDLNALGVTLLLEFHGGSNGLHGEHLLACVGSRSGEVQ